MIMTDNHPRDPRVDRARHAIISHSQLAHFLWFTFPLLLRALHTAEQKHAVVLLDLLLKWALNEMLVIRRKQLEIIWYNGGVVWISLSVIGVVKTQTHFGVHCWDVWQFFHPQCRLRGSALCPIPSLSSLLCSRSRLRSWTGKGSVKVIMPLSSVRSLCCYLCIPPARWQNPLPFLYRAFAQLPCNGRWGEGVLCYILLKYFL